MKKHWYIRLIAFIIMLAAFFALTVGMIADGVWVVLISSIIIMLCLVLTWATEG